MLKGRHHAKDFNGIALPLLRSDQCGAFPLPHKGRGSEAEIANIKEQMRNVSINRIMEMGEDKGG